MMFLDKDLLSTEFVFKASLSCGAGGQHVNKVNTKVELRFHVADSQFLSNNQKEIVKVKLAKRINKDGFIVMSAQTERSQLQNKEKVIERFLKLIEKALEPEKIRIKTKPGKAVREKRLEEKQKIAEKKDRRRKLDV